VQYEGASTTVDKDIAVWVGENIIKVFTLEELEETRSCRLARYRFSDSYIRV